jgi:hypothetical protein
MLIDEESPCTTDEIFGDYASSSEEMADPGCITALRSLSGPELSNDPGGKHIVQYVRHPEGSAVFAARSQSASLQQVIGVDVLASILQLNEDRNQ